MVKLGLFRDTANELMELEKNTAKQAGNQVKQTFNPLKMINEVLNTGSGANQSSQQDKSIQQLEKGQSQQQNNTPLDFNKLDEKYKNDDKLKVEQLKKKFFENVKAEEKQAVESLKREEEMRKRKEMEDEQEKKKQLDQKQKAEADQATPHGKERKSILAPKKKAQQSYSSRVLMSNLRLT
jgi:hypothetical protein